VGSSESDKAFIGSIPKIYAGSLVPLLFEPYALDMAARLAKRPVSRLLELAAGTGVVTRALAASLPQAVAIVATDLNQAMLDEAAAAGTPRAVEWRQADAQALPFDDATFDAIVCQFGVMFFPDKPKAFAEARRVLRPGGVYIFNVWDRLDANELAATITTALAQVFPDDPPRFLARTPYAYNDRSLIERDVAAGGFPRPEFATVAARSRAASASIPALAFCEGTPLRPEIEAHGTKALAMATDAVATAIAARFGAGAIDASMQALVVTVQG
jgi:SAM-dependent methyltransferase